MSDAVRAFDWGCSPISKGGSGSVWGTLELSFHRVKGYDSATIVTGDCIGAVTRIFPHRIQGIYPTETTPLNLLTLTKVPRVTIRGAVMRWGTDFMNEG